MPNRKYILLLALLAVQLSQAAPVPLEPGVRGVIPRAPADMKMDGDLAPFKDAFCTPVEYFNTDLKNRPAQLFYMWDDEAFYAALRTIDQTPINIAADDHLWGGDAIEWYFDTRQDEHFRSHDWPHEPDPGAVHCYWTGLTGTNVAPRFCLRPEYLHAIKKIGVKVAARRTKIGMDVEFKLPWTNFPGFKPAPGTVIALDAEVCYSDGTNRCFRSFAFGSPLSVQQPANLAKVELVEKIEPEYWAAAGPVMTPIRCDTAWNQNSKPEVTGYMALPPNQDIGKVIFRVLGLDGKTLGDYEGKIKVFSASGNFRRATAQWPVEVAVPGAYQLMGIVYDKSGKELTRVAPRMVSVNLLPGY